MSVGVGKQEEEVRQQIMMEVLLQLFKLTQLLVLALLFTQELEQLLLLATD